MDNFGSSLPESYVGSGELRLPGSHGQLFLPVETVSQLQILLSERLKTYERDLESPSDTAGFSLH